MMNKINNIAKNMQKKRESCNLASNFVPLRGQRLAAKYNGQIVQNRLQNDQQDRYRNV